MQKCLLLLTLTLVLIGCRRQDYREMTVEFSQLSAQDQAQVAEVLAKYAGIDQGSYKWDLKSKTLTLRYDSMQIAQSNIRYAIDEKGVKVKFPVKTNERAGY